MFKCGKCVTKYGKFDNKSYNIYNTHKTRPPSQELFRNTDARPSNVADIRCRSSGSGATISIH